MKNKELIVKQNPVNRIEWQFIKYCCYQLKNSFKIGWDEDKEKLINFSNSSKGELIDHCPHCNTKLKVIYDKEFSFHQQNRRLSDDFR